MRTEASNCHVHADLERQVQWPAIPKPGLRARLRRAIVANPTRPRAKIAVLAGSGIFLKVTTKLSMPMVSGQSMKSKVVTLGLEQGHSVTHHNACDSAFLQGSFALGNIDARGGKETESVCEPPRPTSANCSSHRPPRKIA
jgi:hypothetical protein